MKKILIALFIGVAMVACTEDEPNVNGQNEVEDNIGDTTTEEEPEPDIYPLYDPMSYNDIRPSLQHFAWSFMDATLSSNNLQPNFVISPYSLYQILAMVANGAEGSTRQQIIEALGFEGINMGDLNAFNVATEKRIAGIFYGYPDFYTLKIANSLWALPSLGINQAYTDSLSTYYNAETLDIIPSTFQSDVNNWCSDKTNGVIKSFPVPEETGLLVLNTTYFKKDWNSVFEEKNNVERKFHNFDGSESTIEFMHQVASYFYRETECCDLVGLKIGDFSFNILIPTEGTSISDCITELQNGLSDEFLALQLSSKVDLTMPKFKVDNLLNLNEILKNQGVTKMFGNGNFANIYESCKGFDLVQQATSIDVNENGITAAAATGGSEYTSNPGSGTETDPKIVVVDRPFVFFLSHNTSRAIIFSGVVNKL